MAQPPSEVISRISTAVAVATGNPISQLPPLSGAIDPDGLESVVTGESSHDVTITFAYAGQRVLVHTDNTVYVCPLDGTGPGPGNEPSAVDQ